MTYKRSRFGDRRQHMGKPGIPFKDSTGATIRECRRIIPDRRTDSIQAAMINLFNVSPPGIRPVRRTRSG